MRYGNLFSMLVVNWLTSTQDAEKALEQYNVDAIILSNHGGRELD